MFDKEDIKDPSPTLKNEPKDENDFKYNSSPLVRKKWTRENSDQKNISQVDENETISHQNQDSETFENLRKSQNEMSKDLDQKEVQSSDWNGQEGSVEEILYAEKQKLRLIFQKEMEEKLKVENQTIFLLNSSIYTRKKY